MLQRSNRHTTILRSTDALLMAIDMQEPFLRHIWACGELVGNVEILLKAATILRMPIVPTLQYSERLGGPIPDVQALLPTDCIPFDKLSFSCLGNEAIESEVHRSGRKQVLLCGVEAHICVSQTALDLQQAGYQVHVAADAVSSRTDTNKQTGIARMREAGVVITSTEMALYELMVEAGTPEFRGILELVK